MRLASGVADSGGVTLVPAFSGLGAPHWDREATAIISGLTQSTTARPHRQGRGGGGRPSDL